MSKTETKTEIALASEAGAAVAVPDSVVAEVILGIKAAQNKHGFALAQDIGRLIVDRFHGGDMAAFRSRGTKDASLRKLAQHPDLPMSASALQQAVAVFDYAERNPGVYASIHLTPTHVRTVLSLPAPEQDKLLAKAEEKALTVKQLEAEARKAKSRAGKGKGGGRPALPAFVKSIHALGKYVDGDLFGGLDAVDELEVDEAQTLYSTVAGLKARCEELMGRLGGRVLGRAVAVTEAMLAPQEVDDSTVAATKRGRAIHARGTTDAPAPARKAQPKATRKRGAQDAAATGAAPPKAAEPRDESRELRREETSTE